MGWPFVILSFPSESDPDIAMVETGAGELYLEKRRDIENVARQFTHIQAAALSPERSLDAVKAAAQRLEG